MAQTPRVVTLQDAINLLHKVQDREVYIVTSIYEIQYALVLVMIELICRAENI